MRHLILAALIALCAPAWADSLTPAQQATLRAYIDATPELAAQPLNSDGAFAIAAGDAGWRSPAERDGSA